jgi:cation diffusion facilitator family transporter
MLIQDKDDILKKNEKRRVILVSVFSNAVLVLLKLAIGFSTGLATIIAEAMHSGNDLIASLVAFVGVRQSLKPADEEHQYGHGKIEILTGTIENILILLIGIGIIYEGTEKLVHRSEHKMVEVGMIVMIFSGLVNVIVSRYLLKKGRELRSIGIEVDGEHLKADVITSFGVVGALILMQATKLWWIDPVAAIVVGIWVVGIFFNLTGKLTQQIIDRGLSEKEIGEIEAILKTFEDVRDYHKIRTRQSGSTIFIDMHIKVDRTLNIEKAHDMTKQIEDAIKQKFSFTNTLIHIEPYYDN